MARSLLRGNTIFQVGHSVPSVSVDPVPQTTQTSGRARDGRDATAAPNDDFAMFVESDAPAQGSNSSTPPSADRTGPATSSRQDMTAPDASRPAGTSSATSTQDDAAETGEQKSADETAIPIAVFIGLQATVNTPADTIIESSETTPVANPPATLPGETAALALARVAQDTKTQETMAEAQASGKPDQTGVQVIPNVTAPDQQTQEAPDVPAIVATDAPDANAALETAIDLTSRIPTEANTVEANAKLQAIVAGTAETTTEHGRLIASASAQPLLTPLKPSVSTDSQSLAPPTGQDAAKPAGPDTKTAGIRPSEPRQAAAQAGNGADNAAVQTPTNDKPATTPFQPSDNGMLLDATPQAAPTPAHVSAAVPQLTAAPAHPGAAVPVAALAVEIAANVQIGRSRFEIRLDPPELGRIEVKLDVDRQGQVTSHIIVEKTATLDLLRRDAPQLERALQDAGLKTSNDGLQFSLRDQQSQSNRHHDEQRRDMQRLIVAEDDTVPREAAGRSYGRLLSASGGIDMRV